ncbi:hypothetical protein [Nesterenkonia sp.]|uniref:hypothetical protein n=1 Tax=Nesterenkonia sp. TaxID=704201 RepID=UPI00261917E0|nr:hypothetical protein [Nesterenkonia sp.]
MSVLPVTELRPARTQEGSARPSQDDRPALKALPRVRGRQKGLIAAVLALLLAALAAVLVVNIHVANTQYRVVQMQNEHQSLVHENEMLTQQVQHRESPQSLSNAAATLGMVMPAAAGTFDLETSELVNGAEEASSHNRPTNFVSTPAAPGAEAIAPVDISDQVDGAPTGLLGAGALHTLNAFDGGQNGAGVETAESGGAADTGGGTIPAPRLN